MGNDPKQLTNSKRRKTTGQGKSNAETAPVKRNGPVITATAPGSSGQPGPSPQSFLVCKNDY